MATAKRRSAIDMLGVMADDEGQEYQQAPGIFGPAATRDFGEKLMQDRRQASTDRFWSNRGDPKYGFLPPAIAAHNKEWDGFSGIMAGQINAQAKEGRNMAVGTYGSSRPSIRALGSYGSGGGGGSSSPAADGWEHPDVRAAKLRILQGQGDRLTDDNIEIARQRDPMQRRYDQQQENEAAVVRDRDATGPIFTAGRGRAREAEIGDVRAKAFEESSNPFIKERRDEGRRDLETRASMDAFGRAMAGMRPETLEIAENNPDIIDTVRRRMTGQGPAAPRPGTGPGVVDEEPIDEPVERGAAAGDYGSIASSAEMPPVMRTEIEQWLRENQFAVSEKNLMAAYQRLQQ